MAICRDLISQTINCQNILEIGCVFVLWYDNFLILIST
jgi:hypothetical protein